MNTLPIITLLDPPLQQVKDNESNADQNNDLDEHPSNNIYVVDPALQELNEDHSDAYHYQQSTSVPRCELKTNIPKKILNAFHTGCYRKRYIDLGIICRRRRVNEPAYTILAHNVCPKNLEKEGIGYLNDNISLAGDVSAYLDSFKLFIIQDAMIININEVFNYKIPRPPIDTSEDGS